MGLLNQTQQQYHEGGDFGGYQFITLKDIINNFMLSYVGEDKIISCIQGQIHNIVIDMRKKSKTYMQWQSFDLSEKNRLAVLVPKGCANAYLTLKKKTWILYFHSQFYKKGFEKSIKYNDPKTLPLKSSLYPHKDQISLSFLFKIFSQESWKVFFFILELFPIVSFLFLDKFKFFPVTVPSIVCTVL